MVKKFGAHLRHGGESALDPREESIPSARHRARRRRKLEQKTAVDQLVNEAGMRLERPLYLDSNAYTLALRNDRFEVSELSSRHLAHVVGVGDRHRRRFYRASATTT